MKAALAARGMHVDEAWIAAAQRCGVASESDFYLQYLMCDLRRANSTARLPEALEGMVDGVLEGKWVLQIDALEDVGEAAPRDARTLKALLTDGVRSVAAVEQAPVDELDAKAPLGAKLFLHNAKVRRVARPGG